MNAHVRALSVVLGLAVIMLAGGYFYDRHQQSAPAPSDRAVTALPELSLTDLDGKTFQSSEVAGKVVVVNFWASWCGPCVEEVPSLIKLSEAMGSDLRILAISGDTELEDVRVFLKSFPGFQRDGITIAMDPGLALSKQFQVFRLPESFIFDSKGKMVRKIVGTINWSSPEALDFLKGLKN